MKSLIVLTALVISGNLMASTCQEIFNKQNYDSIGKRDWMKVKEVTRVLDCKVTSQKNGTDFMSSYYEEYSRICFLELKLNDGMSYYPTFFIKDDDKKPFLVGLSLKEGAEVKGDDLRIVNDMKDKAGLNAYLRRQIITIKNVNSSTPEYAYSHTEGKVVSPKELFYTASATCYKEN